MSRKTPWNPHQMASEDRSVRPEVNTGFPAQDVARGEIHPAASSFFDTADSALQKSRTARGMTGPFPGGPSLGTGAGKPTSMSGPLDAIHPDLSLWGGPTTPKAGDFAAKIGGLQCMRNMIKSGFDFALVKNDAARAHETGARTDANGPAAKGSDPSHGNAGGTGHVKSFIRQRIVNGKQVIETVLDHDRHKR